MPIRVQCKCGKALNLKDEYAGKSIRCPNCKQGLRVPAPGAAGGGQQQRPAAPTPQAAAPQQTGGLSDLFEEEGIAHIQGPICPACHKEMKPGTVMCMKCGYNAQLGQQVMGHSAAQEKQSEHGFEALDAAAEDMRRDAATQKAVSGQGAPWWVYVAVLSFLVVGSIAGVMFSASLSGELDDEGGGASAPVRLILGSLGVGITVLDLAQFVTAVIILIHAFRNSAVKGICCLCVPFYIYIYAFTNQELKQHGLRLVLLTLMIFVLVGIYVAVLSYAVANAAAGG